MIDIITQQFVINGQDRIYVRKVIVDIKIDHLKHTDMLTHHTYGNAYNIRVSQLHMCVYTETLYISLLYVLLSISSS